MAQKFFTSAKYMNALIDFCCQEDSLQAFHNSRPRSPNLYCPSKISRAFPHRLADSPSKMVFPISDVFNLIYVSHLVNVSQPISVS